MEMQVLSLFLKGLTYQEIAKRLGKSPKAIDNALQRIKSKLMKIQKGKTDIVNNFKYDFVFHILEACNVLEGLYYAYKWF